ncbi:hypothetical protein BN1002_01860 [Bacillus sp. B-jedd]|nr:hypothetical protein BN1002_01860 [Bacillus sp. B-jedd]
MWMSHSLHSYHHAFLYNFVMIQVHRESNIIMMVYKLIIRFRKVEESKLCYDISTFLCQKKKLFCKKPRKLPDFNIKNMLQQCYNATSNLAKNWRYIHEYLEKEENIVL